MNRRTVLILPSLLGGGAEFVAQTWADELSQSGVEVEIVLTRARVDEPQSPLRVTVIAEAGSGRLRETWAIVKLLKDRRGDAYVAMMTRANLQLLFAALVVPRHRSVIGISERNIPDDFRRSRARMIFKNAIIKLFYRRADLFIAISHAVAAYYRGLAGLDYRRVIVVPNPAVAKSGVRGGAGRTGPLVIVVPARLVEKKRGEIAVRVAASFPEGERPEVHFFGDGPAQAALETCARESGVKAVFHGRVSMWFDDLPDGAVVLLPSIVEGFANVLVEAASRGVPSVAGSFALGCADAIVPGVTGYLVAVDSIDAYREAVRAAHSLRPLEVPAAWFDTFTSAHSATVLANALDSVSRNGGPRAAH